MSDHTDKAALPGHAADSPGNAAGPAPGRYMERPAGMMAVGHPSQMSHGVEAMSYQTITPGPEVTITATYGDRAGPLAQAIGAHQVGVQMFDQASASGEQNLAQLGPRRPGGLAPQPPYHSAPNSPEPVQERRPVAHPAIAYNRDPGQLQGGPA